VSREDRRITADEQMAEGPGPVGLYPWLLVAFGAVRDIQHGVAHPAWLATAGLAAFAALYMGALWIGLKLHRQRISLAMLAVLCALTVALSLGFQHNMYSLFPLASIACGALVPWHEPPGRPWAPLSVAGLANLAALLGWIGAGKAGDIFPLWYGTALSGFVVAVIMKLTATIRQLRDTQEELARSAVEQERLRFARDLHDLLGHTLSLMVVKAQAVRRLATRDPGLAAEQAADIETVGRQALTEVRQAVTGYRGRGLTVELDGARTALADAGISAVVRQEGLPLPPEPDALLGWVVREAVTNVIRHSGARTCEIAVRYRGGTASAEITDDGRGGPTMHPSSGHGLGGLAERTAAAGGTLDAGPRRGGGFTLAAKLPVTLPEEVSV
jgi:two-component system sensor histidine kinase DesK